MQQERPVPTIGPFELERENGVVHLTFRSAFHVGVAQLKEILRLLSALDPTVHVPLVVLCPGGLELAEPARGMLARACRAGCRPVAIATPELDMRLQAEVFRMVHRPAFPFRVFHSVDDALGWLRSAPGNTPADRPPKTLGDHPGQTSGRS